MGAARGCYARCLNSSIGDSALTIFIARALAGNRKRV
jgi:hypothetical protein